MMTKERAKELLADNNLLRGEINRLFLRAEFQLKLMEPMTRSHIATILGNFAKTNYIEKAKAHLTKIANQ